jgi:hypothetical protein
VTGEGIFSDAMKKKFRNSPGILLQIDLLEEINLHTEFWKHR